MRQAIAGKTGLMQTCILCIRYISSFSRRKCMLDRKLITFLALEMLSNKPSAISKSYFQNFTEEDTQTTSLRVEKKERDGCGEVEKGMKSRGAEGKGARAEEKIGAGDIGICAIGFGGGWTPLC